jgi:pullulanase/glycogen debranching enzyme
MLLSGDEVGRTQQGNNNAYCQDNATTWFDWSATDTELLTFVRRLVAFRASQPVPSGTAMTLADWADPNARSVAIPTAHR